LLIFLYRPANDCSVTFGSVVGAHVESNCEHRPGADVTPGLESSATRFTCHITGRMDLAARQASSAEHGCFERCRRWEKGTWFYAALPAPEMAIGENEPRKNLGLLRDFVKGHARLSRRVQPLKCERHGLRDGIEEPLGAVNPGKSEQPGIAQPAGFVNRHS
jgi:hypothetical protein